MAEERKAKSKARKRIGHIAGKNPSKSIDVGLSGSKYHAGGSKSKGKKGSIIRKPLARVNYGKRKSKD